MTNKQALREELSNPAIGNKDHLRKIALALLDELEAKDKLIAGLEVMSDNAHEALSAVLESGDVMSLHVINMLKRGLNNQPQQDAGRINGEG